MASTVSTLTKDVWSPVLTNVTYKGQVHILAQENEPTRYFIALVDTGDAPPEVDFDGGIVFDDCFSPSNDTASDYYVMPKTNDGRVVVLT